MSDAIRNCYNRNPEDPIDYIQNYLATLGRQIEKTDAERKIISNRNDLFINNQVERTKVLFNNLLAQLLVKFEESEHHHQQQQQQQRQTTSNEFKVSSKETNLIHSKETRK